MQLFNFLPAYQGTTKRWGVRKVLDLNMEYLSLTLAQKPAGARDKPNYMQLQGVLVLLLPSEKLPVKASLSQGL